MIFAFGKKLYQLGKENGEKKQLQLVIELCKKTPPNWWINREIKNSNNLLENFIIQKFYNPLQKLRTEGTHGTPAKRVARNKTADEIQ